MIYVMTGGGQDLSFRVEGGTATPTATTNKIWVNSTAEISSYDFSADQPQRRSRNKNILCYPYVDSNQSQNGIVWTSNSDGTVEANGTAASNSDFECLAYSQPFFLEPGTYTLSGCPAGGSTTSYFAYVYNITDSVALGYDTGAGRTFTVTKRVQINCVLRIASGTTVSDIVYRPQLEKATAATAFVKGTAEGQVWFKLGSGGGVYLNALESNGIHMQVKGCKQYISGAWMEKPAKIYQGSEWVDIKNALLLLNGSDQCTDITGGWEYDAGGTMTVSNGLVCAAYAPSGTFVVNTIEKIPLANYDSLRFTLSGVEVTPAQGGYIHIAVFSSNMAKLAYTAVTADGVAELDISSYTDSYYVGIVLHSGENYTPPNIDTTYTYPTEATITVVELI